VVSLLSPLVIYPLLYINYNRMSETSNHSNSTVHTVTAGKDEKEWEVEITEEDEYIVHYPEKDKSQIVTLKGTEHCTGTYFEYNETCPHIKAAKKAKRREEDEKIGRYDYVDCPLCGKVHAGSCQDISTHTPR